MKKVDLYTDGACRGNPGAGGYGVVLEYFDEEGIKHTRELSEGYKKTTNNRMELLAVYKGLEALKKSCRVTIYTDSKYIVDSFQLGWLEGWKKNNWTRGKKKEPVKNVDLWKAIVKEIARHEASFVWVKGHDGHEQNERCDYLATSAADKEDLLIDMEYENPSDDNQLKL